MSPIYSCHLLKWPNRWLQRIWEDARSFLACLWALKRTEHYDVFFHGRRNFGLWKFWQTLTTVPAKPDCPNEGTYCLLYKTPSPGTSARRQSMYQQFCKVRHRGEELKKGALEESPKMRATSFEVLEKRVKHKIFSVLLSDFGGLQGFHNRNIFYLVNRIPLEQNPWPTVSVGKPLNWFIHEVDNKPLSIRTPREGKPKDNFMLPRQQEECSSHGPGKVDYTMRFTNL